MRVESPSGALVLVREKRRFYRSSDGEAAIVQPMNHTYVVSVEDLEELISEARHLTSQEARL